MMIADLVKGSKIFHLLWIAVFLGSCTVIQTTDNRTMIFSFELAEDEATPDCGEFKRTIYLQHVRPVFPKVNVAQLSPEEINDVLLAHTEKLKVYLDHEEQYLREDISRHNLKCARKPSSVFQK
ncbi:hypothetical protein D3C81_21810 [compost metagenome]